MKIETIEVKSYYATKNELNIDKVFHKKSLPILSIVQALEGSYGIGIDSINEQQTGTMGAFIAPRDKMQYITHYINPITGKMRAHWIFLDITINSFYRLDDVFNFPVLLPSQFQKSVYDIIKNISQNKSLCTDLSELYKLVDILIQIGELKPIEDDVMSDIRLYVNENYMKQITAQQMAVHLGVSISTLFRKFQLYFNCSPANYINSIRLQNASILIEKTNRQIKDISYAVGFDDVFYFSKMFKKKYDISPMSYRNNFMNSKKS